jgi:REP element-mobilizing transposase RayT
MLYRINGMEDHIHLLSDLPPTIALSDFIRDMKTSTSIWMKKQAEFNQFEGWADGYAALTYSYSDRDSVINYIKNQREHHKRFDLKSELRKLLEEQGVEIEEKFFP